mmetsp:Transcript_9906/g.17849  ORF Transcript_9906/g.17849 Transcript_9906/m.17849 type:complete len:623 (-) Transcript_9906:1928-3796(-)
MENSRGDGSTKSAVSSDTVNGSSLYSSTPSSNRSSRMIPKDAVRELSSFIDEIERKLAAKPRLTSERSTPAMSNIQSPALSSPCLSPRSLANTNVDSSELESRNAELVAEINALKRNTGKLIFARKTLERDIRACGDLIKTLRNTQFAVANAISNAESILEQEHSYKFESDHHQEMNSMRNQLLDQFDSLLSGIKSALLSNPNDTVTQNGIASTQNHAAISRDASMNSLDVMASSGVGMASHSMLRARRQAELESENKQLQNEVSLFQGERTALKEQVASLKLSLDKEKVRKYPSSVPGNHSAPSTAGSKSRGDTVTAHIKRIQEVVIANKTLEKKLAQCEEKKVKAESQVIALQAREAALVEQVELSQGVSKTLSLSCENAERKLNDCQVQLQLAMEEHKNVQLKLTQDLRKLETENGVLNSSLVAARKECEVSLERAKNSEKRVSVLEEHVKAQCELVETLKLKLETSQSYTQELESELELAKSVAKEAEGRRNVCELEARELKSELGSVTQKLELVQEHFESEREAARRDAEVMKSEAEHRESERQMLCEHNEVLEESLNKKENELRELIEKLEYAESMQSAMEQEKTEWLEEYMSAIESLSVEKFELEQKLLHFESSL